MAGCSLFFRGAPLAAQGRVNPTSLRFAVLALLASVWACSGATAPDAAGDGDASGGGGSALTVSVVDLTNAERSRAGLSTLRTNSRLMQAAQLQADQMARLGRLDHVLSGATYPRPEDRLAAVGYSWQAYAENIAYGQRSPQEAVSSWMQSSGHRTNMLNPSLTEMGAGYARDTGGRAYWVQVFGRPLS